MEPILLSAAGSLKVAVLHDADADSLFDEQAGKLYFFGRYQSLGAEHGYASLWDAAHDLQQNGWTAQPVYVEERPRLALSVKPPHGAGRGKGLRDPVGLAALSPVEAARIWPRSTPAERRQRALILLEFALSEPAGIRTLACQPGGRPGAGALVLALEGEEDFCQAEFPFALLQEALHALNREQERRRTRLAAMLAMEAEDGRTPSESRRETLGEGSREEPGMKPGMEPGMASGPSALRKPLPGQPAGSSASLPELAGAGAPGEPHVLAYADAQHASQHSSQGAFQSAARGKLPGGLPGFPLAGWIGADGGTGADGASQASEDAAAQAWSAAGGEAGKAGEVGAYAPGFPDSSCAGLADASEEGLSRGQAGLAREDQGEGACDGPDLLEPGDGSGVLDDAEADPEPEGDECGESEGPSLG